MSGSTEILGERMVLDPYAGGVGYVITDDVPKEIRDTKRMVTKMAQKSGDKEDKFWPILDEN